MSLDFSAPSADVLRATLTGLKLSPCASVFPDSVIHIPRVLLTFRIPSLPFLDFIPFPFYFFDLPIRPISSIFSAIVDRP
jgi:hypothetical protein